MTGALEQFADALSRHSPAEFARIKTAGTARSITTSIPMDEAVRCQCWAEALGVPFVNGLADTTASADFLAKIPIAFARRHLVLGLAKTPLLSAGEKSSTALYVVVGDPRGWQQLEILSRFLSRPIRPMLAPPAAVMAAINDAYQQRTGQAQAVIEGLSGDGTTQELRAALQAVAASTGREDLLDVEARAPVIRLVNLMLFEAVKAGASDVHVQPYEQKLIVRMRIDGILYNSFDLPKSVQEEVVGRIKVMGKMNIAEKRLAQDGRATAQVGDRIIDLRLASLPTSYGERVVIRLLDKSARLYRLDELGMPSLTQTLFRRLIGLEHGLVLVTGPTGSGKSTTLYAALKEIDAEQHNILTLEDPIEYQLEGISQTQVSEKKGMTFASGLRSVLRQDPDIIMVGEIRDRETATMAIQSALTGHLVFSTLHTNDAASAVTRLLDLGIEPYLVASSVVGVLAQRLVRRICRDCMQSQVATPEDRAWLGFIGGPLMLRRGRGCPACRQTGFRGRLGIFELLVVDRSVRRNIQKLATAGQIKADAAAGGMRGMRHDGVEKVLSGMTTIEEIERVTMRAAAMHADVVDEAAVDEKNDLGIGVEQLVGADSKNIS